MSARRNFSDMSTCQKGGVLLTASTATLKKKERGPRKHRVSRAARSIRHWFCMCWGGKERIEEDEKRRSIMSMESEGLIEHDPHNHSHHRSHHQYRFRDYPEHGNDESYFDYSDDDDESDDDTVFDPEEGRRFESGGRDVWLEYSHFVGSPKDQKEEEERYLTEMRRPASPSSSFRSRMSGPKDAARSFLRTVTGRPKRQSMEWI